MSTASIQQRSLRVSPLPSLRLRETLPVRPLQSPPFPFDRPALRYFYLGRNGIYALAQLWNLRDQEILMPAYFHGVEVDTLVAAGVKLRFYPVDIHMRVRIEEVLSRLTPVTRAIYMIHFVGFPGPVEELREVCRDRGLSLIEDCALALLSKLGDRPLGSFGDASVFSLHKTLPLPHGGALMVRNSASPSGSRTERPPMTSTLAYTASAVWRDLEFEGGFAHNFLRKVKRSVRRLSRRLGVVPVGGERFDMAKANLNMSRLSHWVLSHQNYQAIIDRRRRNYSHLFSRLREVSPPVLGELPDGVCPLFYPLRVRNKPLALARLFDRGVDAINFWSAPPAIVPAGAFPDVELLRRTIVQIPCHQDLSSRAVDWLADQVCDLREEL